jgi:hypothetical protein
LLLSCLKNVYNKQFINVLRDLDLMYFHILSMSTLVYYCLTWHTEGIFTLSFRNKYANNVVTFNDRNHGSLFLVISIMNMYSNDTNRANNYNMCILYIQMIHSLIPKETYAHTLKQCGGNPKQIKRICKYT